MRWQRFDRDDRFSGKLRSWRRLTSPFAFASCLAGAAVLLSAATPAPAESDTVVEGGKALEVEPQSERGMSALNPRVRGLLDANPQDFVTICVAGCSGKPRIVQMLPKPYEGRAGSMRTTAGGADHGAGPDDAVTCVAGCGGRPGQIVQRMSELPPAKASPRPKKESWEQELMDKLP